MSTEKVRQAARLMGSKGGKKPKNYTPTERARRAELARGLAARRRKSAEKSGGNLVEANPCSDSESPSEQIETRLYEVIAGDGSRFDFDAPTAGRAMEMAREQGINAVGARLKPPF